MNFEDSGAKIAKNTEEDLREMNSSPLKTHCDFRSPKKNHLNKF